MHPTLLALLMAICSLWVVAGWLATLWVTRKKRSSPHPCVGLTVLKPLCGTHAGLEANLESFYGQDHPRFEIIFGARDPDDPALAVARRVAARHAGTPTRFVVHEQGRDLNLKVRNIRAMLPQAHYDLIVVSDSSIRAPQHYLRELVGMYQSHRADLVMNLFSSPDDRTLGAALESVQESGFVAAGVALPTLLGQAAVVGKSTLFSRSQFARLGGFSRLSDLLAEDFVLGKIYQYAGLKVVVAPTVLQNITGQGSVRDFIARHLRWSMLRWRLKPAVTALEPLTRPLTLLPAALHFWGWPGLAWAVSLWVLRDVGGHLVLRGARRVWLPLLLSPVCDLLMLMAWGWAALKRHVSWHGTRLRLGAGSLIYRERERRSRPAPHAEDALGDVVLHTFRKELAHACTMVDRLSSCGDGSGAGRSNGLWSVGEPNAGHWPGAQ
jgi:ceramide glucosyltransferase